MFFVGAGVVRCSNPPTTEPNKATEPFHKIKPGAHFGGDSLFDKTQSVPTQLVSADAVHVLRDHSATAIGDTVLYLIELTTLHKILQAVKEAN